MPVLGVLPALFGNALAAYVIVQLAGMTDAIKMTPSRHESYYAKCFQKLCTRESNKFNRGGCECDQADVTYVMRDIWADKSACNSSSRHLVLTRRDRTQPASPDNMILLTSHEANRHDMLPPEALRGEGPEAYPIDFVRKVESALAKGREWSEQRARDQVAAAAAAGDEEE